MDDVFVTKTSLKIGIRGNFYFCLKEREYNTSLNQRIYRRTGYLPNPVRPTLDTTHTKSNSLGTVTNAFK
jgi:hypothetical protein